MNPRYHLARMRDLLNEYEPSRERSLAATKLDECEMWLARCKPADEALSRDQCAPAGPDAQSAGYRPYHAPGCPARDAAASTDRCTCGGLEQPVWKPGDEPKAPSTVVEGAPEVAAGE